jgi:NAD(P)-dependent dehydrogenase (short-subunit alcohol dehydrogenase family)
MVAFRKGNCSREDVVKSVIRAVLLLGTLFLGLSAASVAAQTDAPTGAKAVLITGATSGFGRRLTEILSENNYFVYAGARTQADMDELATLPNVEPVRLDVTNPSDIYSAVELVKKRGRGLYALVNNAGVAVLNPMTDVDEKDVDYVLSVNVWGPYRVTKAFAPLIQESKGRIVNVSSISGIFSALGLGTYAMSKHAVEAFNDALAQEMKRFDVKVIAIEPGNFDTMVGKTARTRMEERGMSYEQSPFRKELETAMSRLAGSEGKEGPDRVAEAMFEAISSPDPKPRYLVVSNTRDAEVTLQSILRKAVQLNDRHEHSFTREELIRILDEALQELSR